MKPTVYGSFVIKYVTGLFAPSPGYNRYLISHVRPGPRLGQEVVVAEVVLSICDEVGEVSGTRIQSGQVVLVRLFD